MDKNFLEFWGNFFINAAKGQQQLEDMGQWMSQGFKGFEELTAMFRKCYGLDQLSPDAPDYSIHQAAQPQKHPDTPRAP